MDEVGGAGLEELAAAEVGVAMGAGADVAIESAGVTVFVFW